MPYKDPGQRKEYMRAYRQTVAAKTANRDRMRKWLATPEYLEYMNRNRGRRNAYKARYRNEITMAYARNQLGVAGAPEVLVEVKQLQLKIKRLLKETCNEKHI